jgi:methionyl-tRNA formyltransferase
LKVLIASSSILAIPLFKVLSDSKEYEICGILTNQDKPTGRGQKIEQNELATWSKNKDLIMYKSSNNEEIIKALIDCAPEIVITIAFGQLVNGKALGIPKYGWINIHFSNLPKWRGAAPVQHSILNGEQIVGISIFKLDQGMDTGPIYLAKDFPITDDETTVQVLDRLSVKGAYMVLDALESVKSQIRPIVQSNEAVSYAPKFHKKDGEINWERSIVEIYNQYRALAASPGVWSILNKLRIRIDDMCKSYVALKLKAGEIHIDDVKMYVGASDGIIEILKLTPAGRNSMTTSEFIRGLTAKTGLHFG